MFVVGDQCVDRHGPHLLHHDHRDLGLSLYIKIFLQHCRSGSNLDPYSATLWNVDSDSDPYSEYGSGSKQVQIGEIRGNWCENWGQKFHSGTQLNTNSRCHCCVLVCYKNMFLIRIFVSVAEPKLFISGSGSDFDHNFGSGSSSSYSHILAL